PRHRDVPADRPGQPARLARRRARRTRRPVLTGLPSLFSGYPTMARRRGQQLDGVLLLDKPEGLSSNHALQRARRTLDAQKAGHTGTLDPFATGLLVCCMGRATKICAAMLDADKSY